MSQLDADLDEEEYGAVDGLIVDESVGDPPPITPNSTSSEHDNRVAFENTVNAAAEEFANQARTAYIDATLNGGTISLTVEGGDAAEDAGDTGVNEYPDPT